MADAAELAIIAANIKFLRNNRTPQWNQIDLKEASGVSVRTIQRIELGQPVKRNTLHEIALALGVNIDELGRARLDTSVEPTDDELSSAKIIERWCAAVVDDRTFTHLPATLGDDTPLPMASMYVELRIARALRANASSRSIAPSFSIAQEQQALYESRRAHRLSVEEVFDIESGPRQIVVLGDPGGGKTSMLKRLTLDIASGAMQRWRVPVHVSLQDWWRSRIHAPGGEPLDLLTHASNQMLSCVRPQAEQSDEPVAALTAHLIERAEAGRGDVLLLMDGFDELSPDPDAVEAILGQLRWLDPRMSWVMTSRRAGFDGRVLPDERYELAELDREGIHRLVRNWFSHQREPADPEQLLSSLSPSRPLTQVAHNPFLLSLLCRIHQDAQPGTQLPTTRAGIYGEIFAHARRQMNVTQRQRGRRSLATQRYLGRFCHWLYADAPQAPRQLFSADDWETFLVHLPRDWAWFCEPPPSLDADLLRARLLDRWGEQTGDYHVVHLTLHEYLVADDAVERMPAALIEHRDEPAWREVLRFGAALAWAAGKRDFVEQLVRALLEPVDLCGIRYIEVAKTLADLPLRDTTSLLGWDLRERLWDLWRQDLPYLTQASGSALALLDGDWAAKRAVRVLNGDESLELETGETAFYKELAVLGAMATPLADPRHAALQLLGTVATPHATEVLFEVLADGRELMLARRAAEVLAEIDDPSVRSRLRRWAAEPTRTTEEQLAAMIVAHKDPRPGWVPWLLDRLDLGDEVVQERALSALELIGDERAAGPLITRIVSQEAAFEDDLGALTALLATPGSDVDQWLEAVWIQAFEGDSIELGIIKAMVHGLVMRGSLSDPALIELIDELDGDDACEDVLEQLLYAIQDRSEHGEVSGPELIERLASCGGPRLEAIAAQARCSAAACRIRHEHTSELHEVLVRSLAHPDPDVRACAASGFAIAGRGSSDGQAERRLGALAADRDQAVHARSAAIAAFSTWPRVSDHTLDLLEDIVEGRSEDDPDLRASAAETLANLDLRRLGPLRKLELVQRALAKVASERAYLLFDHGYVDASGRLWRWPA